MNQFYIIVFILLHYFLLKPRTEIWWNNYSLLRWHISINIKHINGLVQERCNSIADALELRLSCTNPSILQLFQLNCFNFLAAVCSQALITEAISQWQYYPILDSHVIALYMMAWFWEDAKRDNEIIKWSSTFHSELLMNRGGSF